MSTAVAEEVGFELRRLRKFSKEIREAPTTLHVYGPNGPKTSYSFTPYGSMRKVVVGNQRGDYQTIRWPEAGSQRVLHDYGVLTGGLRKWTLVGEDNFDG